MYYVLIVCILYLVISDHKACLALLTGKGLNKRLLRFALALQDRPIVLTYRPGSQHGNADGFSRQSWNVEEIKKTDADPGLSARPMAPSLAGGTVGLEDSVVGMAAATPT